MFFDPYIQAIYKHRTNMLRITAVDEAIYDSLIMLRSMYATSLRISWSQVLIFTMRLWLQQAAN